MWWGMGLHSLPDCVEVSPQFPKTLERFSVVETAYNPGTQRHAGDVNLDHITNCGPA